MALPEDTLTTTDLSVTQEDAQGLNTEQNKLFDFNDARIHLKRLIDDWADEIAETDRRRKIRDVDLNVKNLREEGKLDEDETIIPDRVVDTNIIREQPPYINYIKNSRRQGIFTCISKPDVPSQKIELEFARVVTYTGWEIPFFKCIDGAQTHGWAAVEVVFDPSKPGNVGLEYIEHENLYFPRSVKDLQDSPRIIRKLDVTISTLKDWVRDLGFSGEQVDKLVASRRDTQKEVETVKIYKFFFKKEKIVYVGWFALDNGVTDWLRAPEKHFIGIKTKQMMPKQDFQNTIDPVTGETTAIPVTTQVEGYVDVDLDIYPVILLPYCESERPLIFERKGRVFYDEAKQEAQTSIQSAFINGLNRASQIYASPKGEDGSGTTLKELDLKLTGNRILSKPIEFWHMDYPDPLMLKAMQWMDTSNAEETNQVSFATMNRQDSRKTAKEIGAAEQKENILNSVRLTLFSTFCRQVRTLQWLVVQSQALQGKIKFLQIQKQKPQINPLIQQPIVDPVTGQPKMETYFENDVETISQIWEVRAAGDVDVIQKEETVLKMKQDWPVIMNTPLKDIFLADLLRLEYPGIGDQYADYLQKAGGQMQNLQIMVARLTMVLQGMLKQHPEMLQEVPDQTRADLMGILKEGMMMTQQMQQMQNGGQQQ